MPTVDEWVRALATPQRVHVESSQRVLDEVEKCRTKKEAYRQKKRQLIPDQKPTLSVVPPFAPELVVDIAPVSLLHRLGVITTPPVENLADICSTWAYLRYLWAFEIPLSGITSHFRLSEAATSIDFHQKGLLSDQIGMGMAALLLSDFLNAPLAADVSVAMDDPAWPIELQDRVSPDYLFFNSTQENLFVVECKGTQSSAASSFDQLRRGTEQVPSLKFTDGRMPPSLVIATYLSTQGTRVFVIDPPGEDNDSARLPDRISRVGHRSWTVKNEAEFSRATRLVSEAKVLSFAGSIDFADDKIERARTRLRRSRRSTPPDLVTAENAFGIFKGVRQRISLRDRVNVDLFQALQTSVYEAVISEEPGRTSEEMRAFRSRTVEDLGANRVMPPVRVEREGEAVVVRSVGSDASLLELRISAA